MHARVLMCALALGIPAAALAQVTGPAPEPAKPKPTAPAAKSTPEKTTQRTAMSETEKRVVYDLHKLNEAELAVGQLAASKAQSADVKRYAQHLATDHKQSDTKVLALAKKRNVQLGAMTPTKEQAERNKQHDALLQRLKATPPQQFDQAFTSAMVDGHRKAIELVQQALSQCEDADLHVLLQDTLPALSEHMQAAQRLTSAEPAPTPAVP